MLDTTLYHITTLDANLKTMRDTILDTILYVFV